MNSKLKCSVVFAVAACAVVCAFGGNGNGKGEVVNEIADSVNAVSANVNAAKLPSISELKAKMDEDAEIIMLLKSLYEREVQTASGRAKWHGKLEKQIINTNELEKVSVYADGKEFKDAWKLVTPKDMVYGQAKKLAVTTNGIPAKLAAARLKRAEIEGVATSNVTVTVEVGKTNNGKGNDK